MMLSVWVLFIVSILLMVRYVFAAYEVYKHNETASYFTQEHLTTFATIQVWIAFVVFVITAGIIFERMF